MSAGKTLLIDQLRIPTLLGLSILVAGIMAGVYSVTQSQNFYFNAKASPLLMPQNLTLTNTDDSQVTISWQTPAETPVFVSFKTSLGSGQTAIDDRDSDIPRPRTIHHVTLKNLLPETEYQYKIIAGKQSSDTLKFTTASAASGQNGFSPVIGSVLNNSQVPDNGVVYLAISGAVTQSAVTKAGNFVIPISTIRKSDLSDTFGPQEGTIAKITVISSQGESSALFKLPASSKPLPPLRLGQNLDFTGLDRETETATGSGENFSKYDLNDDKFINAADYSIVLRNNGKKLQNRTANPELIKTDLNGDRTIDQKDLELMAKQLTREEIYQ